jgi:lichenan operon transcriptional antiterminator
MLKKRQEKIIQILENSKEWMTGKLLSFLLGVTDRTIRSDIHGINNHFKCHLVESDVRKGYCYNQAVKINQNVISESSIPQSGEERSSYILGLLMFGKNDLNLYEIQQEIFVSSYSIENDLNQIRAKLEPYPGVKLIRSKNYIRLEGDEKSKRILYKEFLKTETKGNFLNLNILASYYKGFDLLLAKSILENVLERHHFRLEGVSFPLLMVHVGIAIERMIKNHYMEATIEKEVKDSREYAIAIDFYQEVSRHIPIRVVESEVYFMGLLLMGKKGVEYSENSIEQQTQGLSLAELTQDVLQAIKNKFDIDFSEDEIMLVAMKMHFKRLIERRKQNRFSSNLYLKDIKWKYPLIFEMAIESSNVLYNKLNIKINEDEVAYIAFHLGVAYERSNYNEKYRVVLIRAEDKTIADLCIDKIESRFRDRMDIIAQLDYFEEESINKLMPDLIITTLPLVHNLSIMTISITLFINREDESKIFQAMNMLDKNKFKEKHIQTISNLVETQFFFSDLELTTPEDIINFMCNRLQEKNYVSNEFVEAVHEREKMSSTSFAYLFAVPHALKVGSIISTLSVAILKNPVTWGDYEVQLVILLAIKEEDQHILKVFFEWMSNVVTKSKEFAELLQVKTRDEFIALLMN